MRFSRVLRSIAAGLACSASVCWSAPVTVGVGTYLFNFAFGPQQFPNVSTLGTFATGVSAYGPGAAGTWTLYDDLGAQGASSGVLGGGINLVATLSPFIENGNLSALLQMTGGSVTVDPSVIVTFTADAGFTPPPRVDVPGVLVNQAVPEPTSLVLVG